MTTQAEERLAQALSGESAEKIKAAYEKGRVVGAKKKRHEATMAMVQKVRGWRPRVKVGAIAVVALVALGVWLLLPSGKKEEVAMQQPPVTATNFNQGLAARVNAINDHVKALENSVPQLATKSQLTDLVNRVTADEQKAAVEFDRLKGLVEANTKNIGELTKLARTQATAPVAAASPPVTSAAPLLPPPAPPVVAAPPPAVPPPAPMAAAPPKPLPAARASHPTVHKPVQVKPPSPAVQGMGVYAGGGEVRPRPYQPQTAYGTPHPNWGAGTTLGEAAADWARQHPLVSLGYLPR